MQFQQVVGEFTTQHGELPLPAPAVACLLKGFPVYNDGRIGERVTPTGAAILKTLNPEFNRGYPPMRLTATGTGFGTSHFEGLSNVLRLLAFDPFTHGVSYEKISVLEFEVDDQTPEDLRIGLERLREEDGVLDVVQIPATGKKSRITMHVRVLGQLNRAHEIALACVNETSTLGVRCQVVDRIGVEREQSCIEMERPRYL